MYFTNGEKRAFELLMQQKPGFDRFQSGCTAEPERKGTEAKTNSAVEIYREIIKDNTVPCFNVFLIHRPYMVLAFSVCAPLPNAKMLGAPIPYACWRASPAVRLHQRAARYMVLAFSVCAPLPNVKMLGVPIPYACRRAFRTARPYHALHDICCAALLCDEKPPNCLITAWQKWL
ncbi:MAG TPA: hypothetical protein IAA75_09190 [Candidatus Pullichristensenella avicola]|nr:hypothetical protein [Candidatus Pullichristensenella avicola]